MERLQYHEFGRQLRMFKLIRENCSNDSEQLQRRRKKDRIRDKKIETQWEQLRTNKDYTLDEFFKSFADERFEGKHPLI